MPSYNIKHIETGEVREMFLTLAEREELLATGEFEQTLCTPNFISQHGSTIGKTSSDWKDLLKNIKKGSGVGNTIKV